MRKILISLLLCMGSLFLSGYAAGMDSEAKAPIAMKKLPKDYTRAMALKNGDVTEGSNVWKLEKFLQNAEDGKTDFVRTTNFTDEGAAIIQDLSCSKHAIFLTIDFTRDDDTNPNAGKIQQYKVLQIYKDGYTDGYIYVAITEKGSFSIAGVIKKDASLEQLKALLQKQTHQQITVFKSFSIGNHQIAAFAITGGDVWFVSMAGADKLAENLACTSDTTFLWNVNGNILFKCEDAPGGSSSRSYAWYVKNGKPVILPYGGMGLSYKGNGQFVTTGDRFDLCVTDGLMTGHTYKPYYLYFTKDGLKEYGGLKISLQQLQKINGAQAVIDTLQQSGHTIDEIYYHSNQFITINYHSGDSQNGNYDNVKLLYQNNTVIPQLAELAPGISETEIFDPSTLDIFSYGGSYQAALFPQIAVYPKEFPTK